MVCASSRTMTHRARLCSLRQRDGRCANRLSNSCTLVVTTTGAAQSSMASRSLLARSLARKLSSSVADCSSIAEWCSRTDVLAKDGPEYLRRLVDHRGEGDGVDDTVEAVPASMVERESERGERLAAAGRDGQREHAGWAGLPMLRT